MQKIVAVAVLAFVLGHAPLAAQTPVVAPDPATDVRRTMATRAELERLAGDRELTTPSEAANLRQRLKDGDFQPGDKIILKVQDEAPLTDSFTVRTDRTLILPNIPAISMAGVLRSELQDYLTKKIAQYIKAPVVTVTSLIRLSILGGVNRPGFYFVPAEMLASEAVMSAGGPTSNADLKKTEIRRSGATVIPRDKVQQAFAQGVSLDQLSLHSGDEFNVGDKGKGATGTLQTVGLISGLLVGIAALGRIF